MKKPILPLSAAVLMAASASAAIVVPVTTTTYTGGAFSNTTSWTDAILPVAPEVGAVALDGNLNANLTNYRVVQTAGTISSGFNRNFIGTDWYIVDGALLFYSTTNLAYTNLNNSASGLFNIYLLGGTFDAAAVKNQGGSVVYIENGVLTAHNSLQLTTGGILRFGEGSGTVTTPDIQFDTTSVIDFLSQSDGALIAADHDLTNYEARWNAGILRIDNQTSVAAGGSLAGSFTDYFTVTGSTLTLVPEPSTYALLAGFGALGLILIRRRKRG